MGNGEVSGGNLSAPLAARKLFPCAQRIELCWNSGVGFFVIVSEWIMGTGIHQFLRRHFACQRPIRVIVAAAGVACFFTDYHGATGHLAGTGLAPFNVSMISTALARDEGGRQNSDDVRRTTQTPAKSFTTTPAQSPQRQARSEGQRQSQDGQRQGRQQQPAEQQQQPRSEQSRSTGGQDQNQDQNGGNRQARSNGSDSSNESRSSGESQRAAPQTSQTSPSSQSSGQSSGMTSQSENSSPSRRGGGEDRRASEKTVESQAGWGSSASASTTRQTSSSQSQSPESASSAAGTVSSTGQANSSSNSGSDKSSASDDGQKSSGSRSTGTGTGTGTVSGNGSGKADTVVNTEKTGADKTGQDSSANSNPETAADSPIPQQQDASFAASTSLADWFRRNTQAAAPALSPTPTPVVVPVNDTSKQPVKPTKTGTIVKPADTKTTAATAVTAVKAAAGATPPPEQLFQDKSSFKPREIVASDLGPGAIAKAKSLGFNSAQTSLFGNLGLASVQRLTVPVGMTEAEAYAVLKREVPSGRFGPNHIFRIVPASDEKQRTASDTVAAAPGTIAAAPCAGDRCFGQSLIGWKSENRSCARKARIGIIDTSYDLSHPAFAGHRFANGNFLNDGAISPHDWHGTAVLSLLAGDVRSGTPGLVPDAEFFLASAFRTDADGNATAETLGVLNALSWLEALDVGIVNMSFSGPQDELIEKAIAIMSRKGIIFIAAAGNRGPDAPPSYPAAYPDVIAVTAVGRTLQGYRHANRGSYVDAAAPGVDVLTALPNGRQGFRTGTSFAAPFFTGILASMPAAHSQHMNKAQILASLKFQDLGSPGRDPIYGEGLAQAPERCTGDAEIAGRPPAAVPTISAGAERVRPMIPADLPAEAAFGYGPASR